MSNTLCGNKPVFSRQGSDCRLAFGVARAQTVEARLAFVSRPQTFSIAESTFAHWHFRARLPNHHLTPIHRISEGNL